MERDLRGYVIVNGFNSVRIPDKCPKCGRKLHQVNAVDTACRLLFVHCTDNRVLIADRCQWSEMFWFR